MPTTSAISTRSGSATASRASPTRIRCSTSTRATGATARPADRARRSPSLTRSRLAGPARHRPAPAAPLLRAAAEQSAESAEQIAEVGTARVRRLRGAAAEQSTQEVAEAAAGRALRGALGRAAEELVREPREHDGGDDRQHLLDDDVGHLRLRRRACERRDDRVLLVAEDVLHDLLAVGSVDIRHAAQLRPLVLLQGLLERGLPALIRVRLEAAHETGEHLLDGVLGDVLVDAELLRDVSDGDLSQKVVVLGHGVLPLR